MPDSQIVHCQSRFRTFCSILRLSPEHVPGGRVLKSKSGKVAGGVSFLCLSNCTSSYQIPKLSPLSLNESLTDRLLNLPCGFLARDRGNYSFCKTRQVMYLSQGRMVLAVSNTQKQTHLSLYQGNKRLNSFGGRKQHKEVCLLQNMDTWDF